ncbi:MAG: hypothetical protein MN733_36040 [Nitrososphaera sp.]|nr:hypothetical protein [Nitrososphaera sp.]
MKTGEDWNLQAERLAWKLSSREGITFKEAAARIIERLIRLGPSPANRKFLRLILKMMNRRGLSFLDAASRIWHRAALFIIRRGIMYLKVILKET